MNAASILGVYRDDVPKDDVVKVHTPDPAGYHDPTKVLLGTTGDRAVAAMMSHTAGFSGWRGVIIPHASRDGGSLGHNSETPVHEVYVDPEATNRSIRVDMAVMRRQSKEGVAMVVHEAYRQLSDPKEAAIVAYGQFSRIVPQNSNETTLRPGVGTPREEPRMAPVQLPGTYVVPKATPGGGQEPQYKAASFGSSPAAAAQVSQPTPVEEIRSIRDAFTPVNHLPQSSQPVQTFKPVRSVLFELPHPFGQFRVQYHDVVRSDMWLVLVYDHSRPMQMVWFPPPLTDGQDNPSPLAAMVTGSEGEPDMLYLVHPTGISFPYGKIEFCILAIEQAKPAKGG